MADQLAQLFEQTALMRERAAEDAAALEQLLRIAEQRRAQLLAAGELTDEERAALREAMESLLGGARMEVAGFAKQAGFASQMLALIDPAEPIHVGIVTAEADLLDSLARGLRALAAVMAFLDEGEHVLTRAGGDA